MKDLKVEINEALSGQSLIDQIIEDAQEARLQSIHSALRAEWLQGANNAPQPTIEEARSLLNPIIVVTGWEHLPARYLPLIAAAAAIRGIKLYIIDPDDEDGEVVPIN